VGPVRAAAHPTLNAGASSRHCLAESSELPACGCDFVVIGHVQRGGGGYYCYGCVCVGPALLSAPLPTSHNSGAEGGCKASPLSPPLLTWVLGGTIANLHLEKKSGWVACVLRFLPLHVVQVGVCRRPPPPQNTNVVAPGGPNPLALLPDLSVVRGVWGWDCLPSPTCLTPAVT
jgi:hypothetical protein